MTEFVRRKNFRREFIRVCLNERDLESLARRMSNTIDDDNGETKIVVETADGHDSFESKDPDFFTSDDMPTEIKTVTISYRHNEASIRCKLSNDVEMFSQKVSGSLRLSVSGEGQGVEQLFRDLERDLAARQIFGQWLLLAREYFWSMALIGVFSAATVFSAFDVALNSWAQFHPEFWGSSGHQVLVSIGGMVMLFSLIAGPILYSRTVHKYLPPIEFSGRLVGRKTMARKTLLWIAVLGVLPIFINIFSGLLLDIVRLWLAAD